MKPPELIDYEKLFSLYGEKLSFDKENNEEGDLSLVFEQVVRLLKIKSEFNRKLPSPFVFVAQKYASGEPAIYKHFQYNENRRFFLSDLHDFIQIQKLKDRGVIN